MHIAHPIVALSLLLIATSVIAAEPAQPESAKPASAPSAKMTAAECEVWARELSFAKSVADHDAVAFADHVEENAAFSAESPQPLRGRSIIATQWAGIIQGKTLRLSWYPTRTTIAGAPGIAVSSGPALFEDLNPATTQRYRLGRFHSVWHRGADGAWRVLFDDGQAPVPATQADVAAFTAGRQATCPQG